jgi:hypothetical protein
MLKDLIRLKVNDGGIIRLIGKWLNAGVMEDNRTTYPDMGETVDIQVKNRHERKSCGNSGKRFGHPV